MKNKDVIILGKILAYCDEILETCRYFGNNLDEFVNNHIFLNACCMCILQIGELCKNISYDIREKESDVEWKACSLKKGRNFPCRGPVCFRILPKVRYSGCVCTSIC